MRCDHCQRPVPKEQAKEVPVFGASGSGGVIVLHKGTCPGKPPPHQTYPESRRL